MMAIFLKKLSLFVVLLLAYHQFVLGQQVDKNVQGFNKECIKEFAKLKPVLKENSNLGIPYNAYLLKHNKEWIIILVDTAKFYSFRQLPKVDTLTPNTVFFNTNLCKMMQMGDYKIAKEEVVVGDLEAPHYYTLGKKARKFYQNFDEVDAGYRKYRGFFRRIMALVGLAKGVKLPKAPKVKNPMAEIKKLKDQVTKLEKEKKELLAQNNAKEGDADKKENKDADKKENKDADKKENKDADKKENKDADKKENKDADKKENKDADKKENKDADKKENKMATNQQLAKKKKKKNQADTLQVVNKFMATDTLTKVEIKDVVLADTTKNQKENPKIKAIINQIDKIAALIDQKRIPELMPKKDQILAQKAELQGLTAKKGGDIVIDEAKQQAEINKIIQNMQQILEQIESSKEPELTSKKPDLESRKNELKKDLDQKNNAPKEKPTENE